VSKKHDKHGKKNWRGDFLKDPGFLSKPVTRKEFRKELKSMRRLEFGPEQRQLKSEKRASNLQQQRIGDWFNQYQQQLGRINTQTNTAYDQAIAGQQQDTASATAYADKLRARMAAQNQESAQLRGATPSPAVDQQAAQANAARLQSNTNFTGLLRSQGATQNAYMLDKKRIGKGEEISQLLAEAARGRQVNQDLRDLAHRKRDFAKEFINQLRPQERDFYLGLLQAQLGNKQAKLSAQTSRANAKLSAHTSRINSRRSARSSRASRRQDARQFNRTHRHGHTLGTTGGGSSSGGGDGEVRRAIQHMVGVLDNTPKKKLNKLTKKQIIGLLINKSSTYTRKEAKKAYKRYNKQQRGHRRGRPYGGGHRAPSGNVRPHR
jgi:hypothetical protein